MTAAEVRDGLCRRWPDDEYLKILEAPQSADRQGRKLDMVVVSLWRSRGHELDGVEIKVSMSDWKRELDGVVVRGRKKGGPEKADWWWARVHRFWIAAPMALAEKIAADVPSGWGLLGCADGAPKMLVKPEKHSPLPLEWPVVVGMMRASADAGTAALLRAEDRGRRLGYDLAHAEGVSEPDVALRRAQAELEQLRDTVRRFEEASGVKVEQWDSGRIGFAVKVLMAAGPDPTYKAAQIARLADDLVRHADQVRRTAKAVESAFTQPELPEALNG